MRLNSFLLREVARSFYELEHVIYHLNLSRHNNAGSHCLRHKIVTVTSITGIVQAEKLSLQPILYFVPGYFANSGIFKGKWQQAT